MSANYKDTLLLPKRAFPRSIREGAALILSVCALGSSAFAGTPADFPDYGFKIEPLDARPGSSSVMAVQFMLPPTEGFAPNVNVMIQPYKGTVKEFVALSKQQFEQSKLTIKQEKQISPTEWTFEYTGNMQGKEMHFFARAISRDGKVFLVTATALETQWSASSAALLKCVASFSPK